MSFKHFRLIILTSILFIPIASAHKPKSDKSSCHFTILILSYNNERWAEENLDSACWQNSTNPYNIIFINDCSTDATGKIAEEYVKKHHMEDKVTIIHNDTNKGAMANTYFAIHTLIPDDSIVVHLDGDDSFSHNNILRVLESYYNDPEDVWITYGSCMKVPDGDTDMSREVPRSIFDERGLRKYPFVTQHIRTFKAWLFKQISLEDFFYEGKFMSAAGDMAAMYPMLEMSYSPEGNHIRYVKELLYYYRTNNPISDFRILSKQQSEIDQFIRSKPPYAPLNSNNPPKFLKDSKGFKRNF